MSTVERVSASTAAHIIQRMGESGQPPERRALAVNVGTDDILEMLRKEYLLPIRDAGRNSSFKLVQAPFGGGKTQFLHCLRELAEREGFCTALVGVSPQECPFDDPVQIYRAVARSIVLPVAEEEATPEPGITQVLRHFVADRSEKYGQDRFLEWVRSELADDQVPIESPSVRRAVVRFIEAVATRNHDAAESLGDYLRGDLTSLAEVAPFRLRELPTAENGFRFLRSLAQVIRHLQLPGLILLFDEMDRTMSLTKRKKRTIGDNLRQMIDHCGQAVFPGVLLVYAVPPEFMTQVVIDYPALEQRLKSSGTFGKGSPLAPIIDIAELPMEPEALFRALGAKLLELYGIGYGVDLEPAVQTRNLDQLARRMAEDILEPSSRRAFVRAAVRLLGQQHHDGVRELSSGDLAKLMRASQAADRPLEGEVEL